MCPLSLKMLKMRLKISTPTLGLCIPFFAVSMHGVPPVDGRTRAVFSLFGGIDIKKLYCSVTSSDTMYKTV